MRKLMLPAAVAAALAFVALDATPAQAQIIIRSGYSSPVYYGGYAPVYREVTVSNGMIFNPAFGSYPSYGVYPMYSSGYSTFGAYPMYSGGYSTFGTYRGYSNYSGYQPFYGSGYSTNRYYGGSYYGGRR
jgi:hypothetical protein